MRRTTFGDFIVESETDDMGNAIMDHEIGDIYAVVQEDEEVAGKFSFEVLENQNGNQVVSSEAIFASADDALKYLSGWLRLESIQMP